MALPTDTEIGQFVGLLVGEGHFGGDGRQPHVTLRMHVRHENLFRWIERTFPGGKVYGPYDHGGRRYYQWMSRGVFLRHTIVPILEQRLTPDFDRYAYDRFTEMRTRYQSRLRQAEPFPEPPRDRDSRDPIDLDSGVSPYGTT